MTLTLDDWEKYGHDIPLLVNLQPAGEYLGEDYYRAGGVPAIVSELMREGLIEEAALTVNGNPSATTVVLPDRGRAGHPALRSAFEGKGRLLVLRGNLFESAIMKTSVIGEDFRARYLSNPDDPDAFEGRAVVFDGPEDYHARIDDPALQIDDRTILFMRGAGPIGYPGAAEVVNMRAPGVPDKRGAAQSAVCG